MTEENKMVEVDIDDSKALRGEPLPEVVTVAFVDVDASWDGTGSLDDHRQKALATLKQPGFGNAGKAKSDGE